MKKTKSFPVRNIPEKIHHDAKGNAHELGISLQEYFVRALKLANMQKGSILEMVEE